MSILRAIGLLRIGYLGTVVIPIYAHLVNNWNAWAGETRPHVTLPVTLFFAFIGSVFLSVGQLLNEVFCPKLVKLHGNLRAYQGFLSEFVAQERLIVDAAEVAASAQMSARANRDLDKFDEAARQAVVDVLIGLRGKLASASEQSTPLDAYQNEWSDANQSRRFVRLLVATCYIVAASIAALVTVLQIPKMFSVVSAFLG